MHKTSIFWNSKLRFAFLIFSISLLFLSCSSNSGYFNKPISNNKPITDNKPVIDPDNPIIDPDNSIPGIPIVPSVPIIPDEPSLEFSLATVPSILPTENLWVITNSGAPTASEFNDLKNFLKTAIGREIKLEFPNIKKIPNNAFYISDLDSIKSVVSVSAVEATDIGESAFFAFTALTTLNFPQVRTIGYSAFHNCTALTTLNFPQVKTIGVMAFYGCKTLSSITIPKVTDISDMVFFGCEALIEMTIATESDLLKLGNSAFMTVPTENIKLTTHIVNVGNFKDKGFDLENITYVN